MTYPSSRSPTFSAATTSKSSVHAPGHQSIDLLMYLLPRRVPSRWSLPRTWSSLYMHNSQLWVMHTTCRRSTISSSHIISDYVTSNYKHMRPRRLLLHRWKLLCGTQKSKKCKDSITLVDLQENSPTQDELPSRSNILIRSVARGYVHLIRPFLGQSDLV